MLKRVLPYSHELLTKSIKPGDFVIDATAGNGNDTKYLSELVGSNGRVFAFDVQEQAIKNTKALLEQEQISNVTLIHDSHAKLNEYLPEEAKHNIGAAIFNLGYLPGSNKQVITQPNSTIPAIEQILENLLPNRVLVLVVYYGHQGGEKERDALVSYLADLNQKEYAVLQYGFINQINTPPFVLAIEKKK